MNRDYKKILKIILPGLLFIIIASYTYFKTRDLIYGVDLRVSGIKDGEVRTEALVEISGLAKNAIDLTINDREVFIDKSAHFDEKLLLLPGYNLISVKAEDKFGKKAQKNYQLILKR